MWNFFAIVLTLYGLYYYGSRNFDFNTLLAKAKKTPAASWAPAVDYYVGLAYFQRADYPKCQEAFTQLLTDIPTSHYAAGALVRQEDCAEYNHDWETAKTAAAAYIEQFPKGKSYELMVKRYELLKYQHP